MLRAQREMNNGNCGKALNQYIVALEYRGQAAAHTLSTRKQTSNTRSSVEAATDTYADEAERTFKSFTNRCMIKADR
jgi:hypothetical protein